jgi:3-oxoacyl-[acyl-carrier protein] reductase
MNPQAIIISGGSRGLGLVLVKHCLARGCAVGTFARSSTADMDQLSGAHPDRFLFRAVDSLNTAAVDAFVETVFQKWGNIQGLVNNAAIGQDHLLANMPVDMVGEIIGVNLQSPILLTRAVVRRMLLGADGRIVNITSICGQRGYAGLTVYSATKGGMDAFTRSLARELGGRGIHVNSIAPGFFLSAMSSSLAQRQLDTIRRRTPTERLCREEDLLPVLDTLLFAESNITGMTYTIDGGSSI